MTDDRPPCTLGPPTAPTTCYCTQRPGCPFDGDDDRCPGDCVGLCRCDDGWDDEQDEPYRPIVTVDTGGLL